MWMTALIVFLSLVAIVLFCSFVLPLFMPSSYSIEKSITVNAPAESCYDKVADLNNYRDWNPWSEMEPDANKKISGTPKTVGHRYDWEGTKIGIGCLVIKSLTPFTRVTLELEFIKPWAAKATDDWTFESDGNQTKIIWKNHGPLAYPMARLMGPMINKNLNKQFEQGLQSIKKLCEK